MREEQMTATQAPPPTTDRERTMRRLGALGALAVVRLRDAAGVQRVAERCTPGASPPSS